MVYKKISHFLSGFPAARLTLCLLCGNHSDGNGICPPCAAELPWLQRACRHCALPLSAPAEVSGICARCLQQAPSFNTARAAWLYAFPIGQLVQRFKYRGDLAAGHSLAQLAAGPLRPTDKAPDLLAPIPLHWRRYWQRGFNQSQLIAAELGRQWHLPVHARLLRRVVAREAQLRLKRSQRLRNPEHSFAVCSPVEGRHIGLVDDVITTGATLEAAARALIAAGAAWVSAYALARTP
ncbi:ComF family protein [Microbulbifer thermotolerans]|uniref:Phosphoribosyltransferase n=1 Tax=Microbulbifer thermotolerans TaxID=252514 RepID=A0A143HIG1_MICTH|nr:ComF family protein [Microbulbifer thermotolerans]AMX01463.1 phosphoribosyltransferase [Microbulbifer thermotolerans]MCX2778304.1 ComF family protein [Microbulbifer thermotolerans]MCX2796134.1 ComF family protein [Microbulbifer thermotolerans]MCX2804343.1 ComF family protein [Microbulbifer thermotolerans]MCX2834036.1 ComF family protein [Microbulbifer thermotolerans]